MDDPFIIKNRDNVKSTPLSNYTAKVDESDFWFGNESLEATFDSLKHSLPRPWLHLFFLIIVLFFLLLLIRISQLQLIEGGHYRSIAEGNRIRIKPIKAPRGIIYDREGNLLARNVPNFSLFFIPGDLPQEPLGQRKTLNGVAEVLYLKVADLEFLLRDAPPYSYEPILAAENIDYRKAILLEIQASMLPGVVLEVASKRDYLFSSPDYGIAHILGYTGKLSPEEFPKKRQEGYLLNDSIGKVGVEQGYEFYLRGQDGKKQIEVDFLGKEEKAISFSPAQDGQSIMLSIDMELQKKAWKVLEASLKNINKDKGVVIVMDIQSGELLALVSIPSFDNNLFVQGIPPKDYQILISDETKPLFNRAIAGEYPPGSTIKPLLALAALQEGIINEETTFLSTGGLRVGEWFFPDWKSGGHGRTNVTKAIADSVNTFFYYIGGGYEDFEGLGLERINYWGGLFGLGKRTGVDILGERTGFLPTPQWKKAERGEPWYIGDTYHLSIGQGDVLVTPLQMVTYISAIANGGVIHQPHLVHKIIDEQNKKFYPAKSKILKLDNISEENLEIVHQGMRQAVTQGSSRFLADLPFGVAGKTGTAEVGGDKDAHAWFVGFAPYRAPEIALVVLVENGGEGSQVAVPIAKEILKYYFENKTKP